MVFKVKQNISLNMRLLLVLFFLLIGISSCIDRPSYVSESQLRISRDTVAKHDKFKSKYELPFSSPLYA